MRVVAVYNRRFDADLAVAMLDSAGIEGVIMGDSNPEAPNISLASTGFKIVVREEISEDATAVLASHTPDSQAEVDELDAMFHRRPFVDRTTFVRYGTYAVLAGVVGPLLMLLLIEAGWLVDGLFP